MLDSIHGHLLESDEAHAVLDVNGLRFRLEIPGSTAQLLPPAGEAVTLLTRLTFNSNEGTFALFGFGTPMERECYDILLTTPGIGPKKALAILSQIEVAAFARAVVAKDLGYFSRIKGVGRKTAERLMVDLGEKMLALAAAAPASGAGAAPPLPAQKENVADAIAALMALGCAPRIAEKAVGSAVEVLGENAPTSDLVREGLKHRG